MIASTRIASIQARRVFDSRGRPTVEADVKLEGGEIGRDRADPPKRSTFAMAGRSSAAWT
jgi:enolase